MGQIRKHLKEELVRKLVDGLKAKIMSNNAYNRGGGSDHVITYGTWETDETIVSGYGY